MSGPNFGLTAPANGPGACMGDDAFAFGQTSGLASATGLNCTANDIDIATADITKFSFDGVNFTPLAPGDRVSCVEGDTIFVETVAHLQNNATARYDIGVWLAASETNDTVTFSNGRLSNAVTGSCTHYNLTKDSAGVANLDGGDACGDMSSGGLTSLKLDVLKVACKRDQDGNVSVGSCIGWQNQVGGAARVCPTPGTPQSYRFGTTPDNKAKCNCGPMVLPIDLKGILHVKKVTVPSGDATLFTFTPNGWNGGNTFQLADGGTFDEALTAGTYGVAETLNSDYDLTGRSCKVTGTNTDATFSTVGNNGVSVVLASGQNVTCTFTNTLKPKLKLVKLLNPTNDPGKFDFTIAGTLFNNNNNGYGHNGTTDFQPVAIGSVSFSEAGHSGTTLSEYATTLECRNAADEIIASNPNTAKTAGSVTTVAGDRITCTFLNNHQPKLSITKTPDGETGTGISPGQTATFTVTVSAAADGGPGLNVQLIDTLPAGLVIPGTNPPQPGWVIDPVKAGCSIAPFGPAPQEARLLTCTIGTLSPGTSFTVVVKATVPLSFLQKPPSPAGDPLEIDGDLIDSPAGGAKDWANVGIVCTTNGCAIDLPTGTTDDSFGQGTKEDTPVPKVVDGSIPNNKSDLQRFYVASERFGTTDFLYLAWERVQDPSGTTNMDFELNQVATLSSNGKTPVRTAGDILIKYDLSQGGVNPVLGFHKWVTTGNAAALCEATNKLPCWGKVQAITVDVAAQINTVDITDPIAPPPGGRPLTARTFGEARINLQAAGIFTPGTCTVFGAAYLKSRSSDSFTAAIKDFIAPIPITIESCEPKDLNNRAWARASNFAPPNGQLNDWFSDTGQIHVSDASGVTGRFFNSLTNVRLALGPTTTSGEVGGVAGDEAIETTRRGSVSAARQGAAAPWPTRIASRLVT